MESTGNDWMTLSFVGQHESITEFQAIEVPAFAVITGLNGSGKTHLLQAINKERIIASTKNRPRLQPTLIDWQTINLDEIFNSSNSKFSRVTKEDLENLKIDLETKGTTAVTGNEVPSEFQPSNVPLAKAIANVVKKNIYSLSAEDITENNLELINPSELFHPQLKNVFVNYQIKLYKTQLDAYSKGEFINLESYQKENPPPWERLNDVLKQNNFSYKVDYQLPELSLLSELINPQPGASRVPIYPPLMLNNNGQNVEPGKLSSGEKVMLSLILSIFSSNNRQWFQGLPEFALFDEVDAFLHPEFSQRLINILHKSFVQKLGMKVILVTHSPSTVALCPEESIFIMNREGPNRLRKASMDEALSTLTRGVPTLSISHDNRRFVFVEGPDDMIFYSTVHKTLVNQKKLESAISITCIEADVRANNDGAGGCEVVKRTLKELSGNKTIFGIIDWDGKNEPEGNLLVLGHESRGNIENYLFEPLPMLFFGLLNNCIKPTDFSTESIGHTSLSSLPPSKLQTMLDEIIALFSEKKGLEAIRNPHFDKDGSLIPCKTISGISYNIPKYFLLHGKELDKCWRKVFEIAADDGSTSGFKKRVIRSVIGNEYFTPLLSADLLNLFERIQNLTGHETSPN